MKEETYPFVMRPLPYECHALAPCISAETLLYHHDKLYKNYVDALNLALADYPLLQGLSLWELLGWPENLPESLKTPVIRNGGGAFNHELYFDSMQPLGREQDPKGALLEAMIRDFGSLREFRDQTCEAAMGQFASGYAWLIMEEDGRLALKTTANQEVPDLKREIPLLNVDVWEHSYYLQYQNRRRDYLCAWIRLVNWRKVARRYDEALETVRTRRMLRGESWQGMSRDEGEMQEGSPAAGDQVWHAQEGSPEADGEFGHAQDDAIEINNEFSYAGDMAEAW